MNLNKYLKELKVLNEYLKVFEEESKVMLVGNMNAKVGENRQGKWGVHICGKMRKVIA